MNPLFKSEIIASTVIILLFSVIVHEVMHGVAALYFGDETAKRAGRLTLNPIPHIDPIGSILLPAVLIFLNQTIIGGVGIIGWAKPVPVNPLNFRNYRQGEFWTSAAGILANIILAILASIIYHIFFNQLSSIEQSILISTAGINLSLALFNLIPIPPLDGSKIVSSLLPNSLNREFATFERYGPFILMGLIFIPGIGSIFLGILGLIVTSLLSLLGF